MAFKFDDIKKEKEKLKSQSKIRFPFSGLIQYEGNSGHIQSG